MNRQSIHKRVVSRLVIAAAFMFATVLAVTNLPAHAADANSEFKGLLISPATQSISLKNGEVYAGKMTVRNGSDNDMPVKMSTGSYTIKDNNYDSPLYDSPSKYSLMGGWIKLDKTSFTLKPKESTEVNYIIITPNDPPSGTQYATIFASTEPAKQTTSGISAVSRVGMVINAKMADGKTIEKASVVDEKIAGYQPTSPLKASFRIKNDGNVGTDVKYQMTVKSAINGKEVYKAAAKSASVYPESARSYTQEWDGVGIGFYNVEQKVTVNGKDHVTTKLVTAVPIWIILLIVVAIAALIAYAIINYRMAHDAKGGNKSTKKTTAKKSATSRKK